MYHFKAFDMINLQYEIRIYKTFLIKPQMTKTKQDKNHSYVIFLKHFYEYLTEKLKYRDVTCIILKLLTS